MSSNKVNLSEVESEIQSLKKQINNTKKTNRLEYKKVVLELMIVLNSVKWEADKNGIITLKKGRKESIQLSQDDSIFILEVEKNLFSTLYFAESKKGLTGKIPDIDVREQKAFLTLIELGYTVEGEINEDGTCKMIQFSKGRRKIEISQKLKSLPFELKGKKYVLTKEGLEKELELVSRINELTALMRDINSCSDINIKQSKISELINNPAIRFDGEKYIININGSIVPLPEAQNQFLLSLDDNLLARIVDKRKGALKVYLINQINQKREELYNVGNLNFEDGIIGEYHMSVQKSFQSIPYAIEVLAKGIELDDSSLLLEKLKRNGFDFNFEEESMSIDGAKTVELSDDIIEKLQQLGIYYQNDSEITKKIKTIQMNILSNMVEALDGTKLTKSELKNKSIVLSDVPDYELDIDSYGSMFVTIENKKYHLPLAFSRKMLSLGALQDEQVIIKHLEGFVPELFGEFQNNRKDNNYDECRKICKKLMAKLNDDEISTEYSKRKYTVTSKKTGKTVQLSSEYSSFLSELEETLFNTIYNAEKDSDVDGQKSVVQDVNGYNTLIQMMELGYNFYINTDKDDNIEQDEVIIISPTKKDIIRDVSDFGDIKTGELPWTASKDKKASNTLIMEKVEQYKELAEYINNKIYPAIETAEKHLDGNGDNLQIELSIKYLLEALNPNDGDKLTSYVNGVYVIVSEKNEIAISLDKTLSEKIDRLTKEYIEILYQNNKTTSKKPSNEQGKSKEDIIEDIRSYFSNGGIKIEDIENKISPVFDENGERISVDINAQKTIIQLMELGYRFKVIDEIAFDENMSPVKDGKIEITSPCGKTFICSALEYNEKGLPHTQKMFDQIQAFAKSEEESKDYSTTNFYDFLMKDAEKENSYKRKKEDKRAKERYEAGENKRKLNEFTREPIVKKINEIQELRQNNEDYFKQLIYFYRSLQEIENIEMKYNAEFGVHVIYNYSTEAYTILPKEQSQVLGELAKEFVDYTLEEGGKSDFEFDDLSGFITLLQLGFVFKPVQENEKKRMDIYDPFDQYVEINRSNKKVKNMETSDKSCVEYYISMQEMIECVNKKIAPKMRKVKTEQKPTYEQIKDILKSIGELTTSNGDSIIVDENKNKLCFINKENGYSIPLNKEQIEFITAIEDKFVHDDIYIAMAKKLIKTISAKDNGSDGNGTARITCSESQEPNYIAVSYIMYKTLKDLGLDFTVYEGGISRLEIKFPWNTKKPIQSNINFFLDDLASKEIWIRLPKTQDSLDLYDEAYSLGITDGEKFVDFLIKRAIEDYKKTHTLAYLKGKAKNLGQRAEVFRNRITAPVRHKIGTSAQVSNPAGPIYTALGMFTGKKPHTSIIAWAIQCKGIASEDPSNPDKPGSTEEGVGIDD